MSNAQISLNRFAAVFRGVVDRRTIGGVFVGAAIMVSAMSTAQTSGNWFSNLFTNAGSGSSSSGALISQQDSVVATAINQEATDCANGASGTIGEAIKTAMNVHNELASATPNVESLFDINSNCFSSISQIFDLSSAIPSWGSILAAAEQIVLQYAQKKICTAVNQVTGMVTTPINSAIGKVNSLQGYASINGMSGMAMNAIDSNTGSSYHPTTSSNATYSVNTNPFGTTQTTFSSSGTTNNTNATLNANTAQINSLTSQIGQTQIAINQDQMNLQSAQNAYNSCNNGWDYSGCNPQFLALQAAQAKLASDQSTLISQQTQLSQVVTQSGVGTQISQQATQSTQTVQSATNSASSTPSSSSSSSWWSGIF